MYKFLATIFFIVLIGFGGYFYGEWNATKEDKIEITSQTIIDRIADKYFVVTKTILVDEETQIVVDKGSDWNNILWGQQIDAEAKIRIDLGVDMTKLKKEDIDVNTITKKIKIKIPHAEILDSSIFGKFDVDSEDGILKKLFKDTTNEDYNDAIKIMKKQAEEKVKNDPETLKKAEEDAVRLLDLVLDNLDYSVEFEFEDSEENIK
jgi:hypothetical protein